jgi:hypothetical protein
MRLSVKLSCNQNEFDQPPMREATQEHVKVRE